MTRYTNLALLTAVLFLGVCYGQERADAAKRDVELARLGAEAKSLAETTARAVVSYAREKGRADSLHRVARAAAARRDRAVASSDSTLARVDSTLQGASTDSCPCHVYVPLIQSLRASLLSERAASSVVIASLEQTIAAKDSALAAADSVIVSQSRQVEVLTEALRIARQTPPWYRRFVSGATKVAVGVAIGVVLTL